MDILFFSKKFENKDEFIVDSKTFSEYITTHGFEGKPKQILLMPPSLSSRGNETILASSEDIESTDFLELGYLIGKKIKSSATIEIINFEGSMELLIQGIMFSEYSFDSYKTKETKESIEINFSENLDTQSNELKKEAVFWVRDMINTPPLDKTPEFFIENIKNLNTDINLEIHDEKWLEENNFGAVLGVAKGSERKPYFLVGEYNKEADFQIALIGKGVMFDSGGLSLKSPAGMETMKTDMAGAATAWGVMSLISKHKINVGLTVFTPIVENMPSGSAIRPGDVLTARNGKTIEVLNTDAEGRLVLADALAYTEKNYKPSRMIDVATLTGSVIVALGDYVAGMYGTDDKTMTSLFNSGEKTHERVWKLPLYKEYIDEVKSNIADYNNMNYGRNAGSIMGAAFLSKFVDKTPWTHIDIAGTSWIESGRKYYAPGATGFGVRLLINYLKNN